MSFTRLQFILVPNQKDVLRMTNFRAITTFEIKRRNIGLLKRHQVGSIILSFTRLINNLGNQPSEIGHILIWLTPKPTSSSKYVYT